MEICTKFNHFILGKKNITIVTSCEISRRKCTKFDFGWGSGAPPKTPLEELTAPPGPLVGISGDLLLRGASKGEGSRKEGRVGEEEEKGNERTGGGRGCAPPTN